MSSPAKPTIVVGAASMVATGAAAYYYYARVSNPFRPWLIMRLLALYGDDDDPSNLSPYFGVHHLPLSKVVTLVEGIPGKICPVRTYTFDLPDSNMVLSRYIDLSAGDVVKTHCIGPEGLGGGHKNYSPTDVSTPGKIDLTVKIYPDGENSQLFDKLRIGDTVGMSGPWPPPKMRSQRLGGKYVHIVCYGVGITEAIEVARDEILNRTDAKLVTFLYANRYQEDAFFREELAELQKSAPDRFKVVYLYSRAEAAELSLEEAGGVRRGRVDAALLKNIFSLPTSSEEPGHRHQRFLVVGSRGMIDDTWEHLGRYDYNREDHGLLLLKLKFFGKRKERTQKLYSGESNRIALPSLLSLLRVLCPLTAPLVAARAVKRFWTSVYGEKA